MTAANKGFESTPIALTNHSYFNLDGHDSKEGIWDHVLDISADSFTPRNEEWIPTKTTEKMVENEEYEWMDWNFGSKIRDKYIL